MMYTSTKYFKEIGPCAYRNWRSDTDCYLLHGYDRSFKFVFGATHLDKQGFVVDFGGLKEVKRQLEDWFDHTTILQADDPLINVFREIERKGHLKLKTFPLISCEGLAEYVGEYVDHMIRKYTDNRAFVITCEMIEAEKNSAIYTPAENKERISWEDWQELNKQMEADSVKITLENL